MGGNWLEDELLLRDGGDQEINPITIGGLMQSRSRETIST